ncbi:MAG TPA: hypothetical protein VK785_03060 [Opitutaceae bacterium]|nr:hypothetical protein [Opitutaceae bacterium]
MRPKIHGHRPKRKTNPSVNQGRKNRILRELAAAWRKGNKVIKFSPAVIELSLPARRRPQGKVAGPRTCFKTDYYSERREESPAFGSPPIKFLAALGMTGVEIIILKTRPNPSCDFSPAIVHGSTDVAMPLRKAIHPSANKNRRGPIATRRNETKP